MFTGRQAAVEFKTFTAMQNNVNFLYTIILPFTKSLKQNEENIESVLTTSTSIILQYIQQQQQNIVVQTEIIKTKLNNQGVYKRDEISFIVFKNVITYISHKSKY